MPILNYTTIIDAADSIAAIQKTLAMHGASQILSDYDDQGNITALSFRIPMDGGMIAFRLPSDWQPVLHVLQEQREKQRRAKKSHLLKATEEQARKVAWRIIKDWVEAQMAIVEIRMVTVDQVFLPYAIAKDGRTLYETVKSNNLLLSA